MNDEQLIAVLKEERDAALAEVARLKGEIDTWITSDKRFAELQDLRAQLAAMTKELQGQKDYNREWERQIQQLERLLAASERERAVLRTALENAVNNAENLDWSDHNSVFNYATHRKSEAVAALAQPTPPQECQPVEGQGERACEYRPGRRGGPCIKCHRGYGETLGVCTVPPPEPAASQPVGKPIPEHGNDLGTGEAL